MIQEKPKPVSLEPAAFEVGPSEGDCRLLANKCDPCSLVFFPRRHFCTRCCAAGLAEIRLSKGGLLGSFTTVYQRPKYAVVEPPYLMGEVELPEGVVVYSLLIQCSVKDVKIGTAMELAAVHVREGESEGKPVSVLAYAFKPR